MPYSDEPSLLDFAAPPESSQDPSLIDEASPQHQQFQTQGNNSSNLLDFGETPPSTQQVEAPMVDLFGEPQLPPPGSVATATAFETPNLTQQNSNLSVAQPLIDDLFGAPNPPLETNTAASPTHRRDSFAPIVTTGAVPSHPSSNNDPFSVLAQPQQAQPSQAGAFPDPFSTLSAQTERRTESTTKVTATPEVTKPKNPSPQSIHSQTKTAMDAEEKSSATLAATNPSGSLPSPAQPNTLSNDVTITTDGAKAVVATEPKPSQMGIATEQIGEEEKKDQDPAPMMNPTSKTVSEIIPSATAMKAHETDAVAQKKESSPAIMAVPEKPPPPPVKPATSPSKFLSTLAKQTKKQSDSRAAASAVAAKRFASFKTMAGSMAAKGAAAVKTQIQQDGTQSQNTGNNNTNSNRFANFKTMAGSMAAKGAAAVKTQIQQPKEGDNIPSGSPSNASTSNNAKRFAGLKNMAGKVAARGAKSVSNVQVPQQLASVQVPQRFSNAASSFGKWNQRIENKNGNKAASNSNLETTSEVGRTTSAEVSSDSPSDTTNSIPNKPKTLSSSSDTTPAAATTATHNPTTKSTALPSTPETESADDLCLETVESLPPPEKPNAIDAQKIGKASGENESKASENKESSNQSLLERQESAPREIKPNQIGTNTNPISDSNTCLNPVLNTPASPAQKISGADEHSTDGKQSPSKILKPENTCEKSAPVPARDASDTLNHSSKNVPNSPTTSSTEEDETVKPEGILSSPSSLAANEMIEAESTKCNDMVKVALTQNHASPDNDNQSSSSDLPTPKPTTEQNISSVTNSVGASEKDQNQQTQSVTARETSDQIEVLQKELHAAHTLIMQLQHHENVEEERPGDAVMVELQANLEKEMTRRAEAEEQARIAIAKAKRIEEEYQTFQTISKSNIDELTTSVEILNREKDEMEKELVDIREERDEQARKEMALTTRLNAAKKKEAVKANAAEHYEDQVEQLELTVKEYGSELESLTAERDQLKVDLGEWKEYAEKRTEQLETALNDEKKLNDERKKKMKGFVEAKTEEVRSAKADYLSLQTELDQTSHSLTELNQRYKQLHAQWVQSQTRNRELQRDAMKMKKDSEKMHKFGDSLEARLSRSAQQSEDHKNKRIHARNELMSVLGQLEAERAVNSRFQESIKLTFTPKALSQQQTIQEALDDFEGALQKLSTRVGRPVPQHASNDSTSFNDGQSLEAGSTGMNTGNHGDTDGDDDGNKQQGSVTISEINTNRAIQKLENETQRVSKNIMKFSASIERMHTLLDGGGTRNCVDVLSQMLLISGKNPAITANSTRRSSGGQRYGQISSTMT